MTTDLGKHFVGTSTGTSIGNCRDLPVEEFLLPEGVTVQQWYEQEKELQERLRICRASQKTSQASPEIA